MNNLFYIRKHFKAMFLITTIFLFGFAEVDSSLLITPGYGVSDYFALMPEKVLSIKAPPHSKNTLHQSIKHISFSGKNLRIELQKGFGSGPSQVSLYTISGKKVFHFLAPASKVSGSPIIIPFPKLSKGVYLVNVETKTERVSVKLVFSGR